MIYSSTVLDFVLNLIGPDFNRELEVLNELTPGLRAIYTTMVVEAEVCNGGFNQYFWNSEGRTAEMAVSGFRQIGSLPFETLMRRAIQTWKGERSVWQRFRAVATLESFSATYKFTNLGVLDEEFYRLNDSSSLSHQRINYIRQRPEEFVTSPEKPTG